MHYSILYVFPPLHPPPRSSTDPLRWVATCSSVAVTSFGHGAAGGSSSVATSLCTSHNQRARPRCVCACVYTHNVFGSTLPNSDVVCNVLGACGTFPTLGCCVWWPDHEGVCGVWCLGGLCNLPNSDMWYVMSWGLVQPPQLWDVVCDGLRVCVVCDGLTVCVVDIVGGMKWFIVCKN